LGTNTKGEIIMSWQKQVGTIAVAIAVLSGLFMALNIGIGEAVQVVVDPNDRWMQIQRLFLVVKLISLTESLFLVSLLPFLELQVLEFFPPAQTILHSSTL
jgi:phage-related protein